MPRAATHAVTLLSRAGLPDASDAAHRGSQERLRRPARARRRDAGAQAGRTRRAGGAQRRRQVDAAQNRRRARGGRQRAGAAAAGPRRRLPGPGRRRAAWPLAARRGARAPSADLLASRRRCGPSNAQIEPSDADPRRAGRTSTPSCRSSSNAAAATPSRPRSAACWMGSGFSRADRERPTDSSRAAGRCASRWPGCCSGGPTCCCWTSRPTTSTWPPPSGSRTTSRPAARRC